MVIASILESSFSHWIGVWHQLESANRLVCKWFVIVYYLKIEERSYDWKKIGRKERNCSHAEMFDDSLYFVKEKGSFSPLLFIVYLNNKQIIYSDLIIVPHMHTKRERERKKERKKLFLVYLIWNKYELSFFASYHSFSFLWLPTPLCRVWFVFDFELEVVWRFSEDEFGQPHPVVDARWAHQRLEVVSAAEDGNVVVQCDWRPFEKSNGNISAQKREPMAEECACVVHALIVRAPMLQPVVCVTTENFKTFWRWNIPSKKKKRLAFLRYKMIIFSFKQL